MTTTSKITFKPAPTGFWGGFVKIWRELNIVQKVISIPIALVLSPAILVAVVVVSVGMAFFVLR